MGMALFFCLSGYLIVGMLYRDPDVVPFICKRVMRIVPALFLYLTVLLVAFDLPLESWVLNMLFVSNYLHQGLSGGPVGHLWSLCVEMQFYVVIGLVVLVGGYRTVWLVIPAAVLVTAFRFESGDYSSIVTHLRVDEILTGGWLALASIHFGDRLRRLFSNTAIASGTVALLCGLFMLCSHERGGAANAFRAYLSMALVGMVLHSEIPALLRLLESRFAQGVARISYALYLWHPLMVAGFMNTGSVLERYVLKRPVSWALTWAAALASTMYWEEPWQRKVRIWLGARLPPAD